MRRPIPLAACLRPAPLVGPRRGPGHLQVRGCPGQCHLLQHPTRRRGPGSTRDHPRWSPGPAAQSGRAATSAVGAEVRPETKGAQGAKEQQAKAVKEAEDRLARAKTGPGDRLAAQGQGVEVHRSLPGDRRTGRRPGGKGTARRARGRASRSGCQARQGAAEGGRNSPAAASDLRPVPGGDPVSAAARSSPGTSAPKAQARSRWPPGPGPGSRSPGASLAPGGSPHPNRSGLG